jgi:hypothetical protein
MTSDGSGQTLPGSSLTWDRASSCWRTSPDLFGSGSLTSSPTLPTSGSMRNGVCSQRPPLAHLTDANGSGSWPTPKANDSKGDGPTELERAGPNLVAMATRMWGTPVARDDGKSPEAHMAMKHAMGRNTATSLTVQAKMWPTPRAHDGASGGDKASSHPKSGGDGLQTAASRHHQTTTTDGGAGSPKADLNPRFVAALMGVPWDWLTPCISVGTASFLEWQRLHSVNSQNGQG